MCYPQIKYCVCLTEFLKIVTLLVNINNIYFQTHLTFGKEFTQAVELKQVAQQEAERAKFLVEKASDDNL